MSPLEVNAIDRPVSRVPSGPEIRSQGRDPEHPAATGNHLLSISRSGGMKYFGMREFCSILQPSDHLSFFDGSRITFGRHHHAYRRHWTPLQFHVVESPSHAGF